MNSSHNNDSGPKKAWLPIAAIACIAIAAGVFVGVSQSEKNTQHSVHKQVVQAAPAQQLESATYFPDDFKQLPAFSLPYGDNNMLSEANFKDKWSVLFFGFTHCPDICPNTLNELNGVVSKLANENKTIPPIMDVYN